VAAKLRCVEPDVWELSFVYINKCNVKNIYSEKREIAKKRLDNIRMYNLRKN